jgi:hypothetical protein
MVVLEQCTGKDFEEIEFVLIDVLSHNLPRRTLA